ncbi:hypothetical protein TTHERM_000554419 (macronuclear) [Tetrahymena thermophila SB210]|uniref:Uncharacterized protein n=1 Tax=Tetrahymena thermophila (strain SB210) TaxID=312017 RepID=W7XEG9_TETTS|nr:hypothetical protein TTHERM_000554419 [Tetrahymena thermophila SB210]EWS76087.1 hypothetical protein TTHERM_000554419 [Tetrahymena thermophila SB210]|eukprot:XP_012651394.1 hypothetical protein TTHERM_000554419 [Tetrahymena thermophila SB210]
MRHTQVYHLENYMSQKSLINITYKEQDYQDPQHSFHPFCKSFHHLYIHFLKSNNQHQCIEYLILSNKISSHHLQGLSMQLQFKQLNNYQQLYIKQQFWDFQGKIKHLSKNCYSISSLLYLNKDFNYLHQCMSFSKQYWLINKDLNNLNRQLEYLQLMGIFLNQNYIVMIEYRMVYLEYCNFHRCFFRNPMY